MNNCTALVTTMDARPMLAYVADFLSGKAKQHLKEFRLAKINSAQYFYHLHQAEVYSHRAAFFSFQVISGKWWKQ